MKVTETAPTADFIRQLNRGALSVRPVEIEVFTATNQQPRNSNNSDVMADVMADVMTASCMTLSPPSPSPITSTYRTRYVQLREVDGIKRGRHELSNPNHPTPRRTTAPTLLRAPGPDRPRTAAVRLPLRKTNVTAAAGSREAAIRSREVRSVFAGTADVRRTRGDDGQK